MMQLDYQKTVELTPVERRAARHLIGWGVAMWVIAGLFALLALVIAAGFLFGYLWVTGSFAIEITVFVFGSFLVPTFVAWRMGTALMEAHEGVTWRSAVHTAKGAESLGAMKGFALLLIAIFVMDPSLFGLQWIVWGILLSAPFVLAGAAHYSRGHVLKAWQEISAHQKEVSGAQENSGKVF